MISNPNFATSFALLFNAISIIARPQENSPAIPQIDGQSIQALQFYPAIIAEAKEIWGGQISDLIQTLEGASAEALTLLNMEVADQFQRRGRNN